MFLILTDCIIYTYVFSCNYLTYFVPVVVINLGHGHDPRLVQHSGLYTTLWFQSFVTYGNGYNAYMSTHIYAFLAIRLSALSHFRIAKRTIIEYVPISAADHRDDFATNTGILRLYFLIVNL